ncbi:hypothetical protein P4V74_29715 [Bacillus thuringiensis]|uniref:hypothetical protein n=1 Tax=Bacillus cereus group sp. BfR-BA-01318 TaxID=2920295 RepID=UPI001F57676F|nr:hypothetical protein [Bacillus cereus group sp. BfR-BA-01318]MED2035357.1 hypothetical protein [Bacillus thuringiensis]
MAEVKEPKKRGPKPKVKDPIDIVINVSTPQHALMTRQKIMQLYCERKIDRADLGALNYSLQGASSEHANLINLTKIQQDNERIKIQERDVIVREETKLKLENKIEELEAYATELEAKTIK